MEGETGTGESLNNQLRTCAKGFLQLDWDKYDSGNAFHVKILHLLKGEVFKELGYAQLAEQKARKADLSSGPRFSSIALAPSGSLHTNTSDAA